MKILIYMGILLSFLLVACGEVEKPIPENTKVEYPTPKEESKLEDVDSNWQEQISTIANNSDLAKDKFYALELYMMNYVTTPELVEQFKVEIVEDYKSGTYLSELENHQRMLSNIFKSYIVEQNSEGAIKDFAFDYFQNLKYTYRGVDTIDSAAVKSNEDQMNKALNKM